MMGLLFSAAMLGAAAVAWPIYLHVRRRQNQRVVTVPSLRLFGFNRQRARRIRLQQLLLMLVRVLTFLVLALLVAQPFLKSSLPLPLPPVSRVPEAAICVGVVLDDSLTALAGAGPENRLAAAKAWLHACLPQIEGRVRVTVAATSFGEATPLMSVDDALALIDGMAVVPGPGNADDALDGLRERLSGRHGAIVVLAPRNRMLWSDLDSLRDGDRKQGVVWVDVTPLKTPAVIRDVVPDVSGDAWICHLEGVAEEIAGRAVAVSRGDDEIARAALSLAEAVAGRVALSWPPGQANRIVRMDVVDVDPHPWATYWVTETAQGSEGYAGGRDRVAIMRRTTAAGLTAEKVLSAALTAIRPGVDLVHLDASLDPGALPESVGLALIVGPASVSPEVVSWMQERVSQELTVLCVPDPTPESPAASPIADGAPWPHFASAPAPVPDGVTCELEPRAAGLFGEGTLEVLRLAGLAELPLTGLRPLRPAAAFVPVVKAGDAVALAVAAQDGGGAVWALGVPVDVARDGGGLHPAFLFLLQAILFPAGETEVGAWSVDRAPQTGDVVDVGAWFGVDVPTATCIDPSGTEFAVHPADGTRLRLADHGVYTLRVGGDVHTRAVNAPRLPDSRIFTRQEWAVARPHTPVRWLAPDDPAPNLTAAAIDGPADAADDPVRTFDLTPAAIVLLLGLLACECVLLWLNWRFRVAG